MKEKEIQIDVLQKSMFAMEMKFCCNLSPEEMRERKKEVEDLLPIGPPGAFFVNGWDVVLDPDDKEFAPVKCSEKEGRWHYIAFS